MSDETNTYGDDIHLTTTDATTIYNTLIAALEKGAGEPLYPGDERRIFGEGLVAVFVALYNSLDDTGRQTLLRYARGEVLDAIGERLDVRRLEGSPAKTTMRFSVSTPQPNNIIIPKWTKVTPDSDHYFATDEIAVLQAGAYSVEIPTSAVSNGTEYNGYAPGTITTLVDLIPYIESVTNITATAGGDDGEPYTEEGDNRLRERIRLAPASRSTAGPEQAYIYWAMTADSSIIDARAVSETETISRTLTVYDGHAFIGGGRLLPDTLIVKEHGESTAGVEDTDYTVDYTDDLLTIELKGALADATSLDITIIILISVILCTFRTVNINNVTRANTQFPESRECKVAKLKPVTGCLHFRCFRSRNMRNRFFIKILNNRALRDRKINRLRRSIAMHICIFRATRAGIHITIALRAFASWRILT